MSFQNLPLVPDAQPERCVLDAFRLAIAQKLHQVFPNLTVEQAYGGVDYSKKDSDFTVAIPRFKMGGKPTDWTEKFKNEWTPDEWVDSLTVNGPFLALQMQNRHPHQGVLGQIDRLTRNTASGKPEYGSNDSGKGKKIVIGKDPLYLLYFFFQYPVGVTFLQRTNSTLQPFRSILTTLGCTILTILSEYSSPNIAKKFHVGHLRSTIIGAFLINLYRTCGWETVALNYLGDWGKQFGLIAVGYEKYGNDEAMKQDPIKHLYDVYVKINADADADESVHDAARAYFKRMEDGDESALLKWRQWRADSIERYKGEYKVLNVEFDEYIGESMVGREVQLEAIQKLTDMGLVEVSENATRIDLETKYKLGKPILLKTGEFRQHFA
jgi:arginyl-tRNA synthetase